MADTNLQIQMAPIPGDFKGTPQDFATLMVRLMKIISPTGTNFFFVGDVEPTSNAGPWLKNGTQWWVFDNDTKRYVPLDISESETTWFHTGNATPSNSTPPVWLKTTNDPSETNPSLGDPIGWYVFNGAAWVPYNSIVLSGPTANRPATPVAYQQYYDTDISVLIWWERSLWRTVSGCPGDIKQVGFTVVTEALTANPGWSIFGISNQSLRGRYLVQAAKDSGASPETVLTTSAGVGVRAAFETFGETDGVKIDGTSPVPYPPSIALWTLIRDLCILEGMTKICSKCGVESDNFYIEKSGRRAGKPRSCCRACEKIKCAKWKASHPDIKKYYRDWYHANPDQAKANDARQNGKHKMRMRSDLEYAECYRKSQRQAARRRNKIRVQTDRLNYWKFPEKRLKQSCRTRIRDAIRRDTGVKSARTMKLIGCSIQHLKLWLVFNFQPGMSLKNYGLWHVDHIRPCASFDLSDPKQQAECFHYTNLQPLWAVDNLRKGDKMPEPEACPPTPIDALFCK